MLYAVYNFVIYHQCVFVVRAILVIYSLYIWCVCEVTECCHIWVSVEWNCFHKVVNIFLYFSSVRELCLNRPFHFSSV